jgi:hypothetical protein
MKEYQWELLRESVELNIENLVENMPSNVNLKRIFELKIRDLEQILKMVKARKL